MTLGRFFKGAAVLMAVSMELASAQGRILERGRYEFPSWEEALASTDVEDYSTGQEYRQAVQDPRYVLEKLKYRSDGLAVVAYLYHPPKETAPRPVIVFNRGSYIRGDIAPELLAMFHRMARAGFTIVAPMYRGSDGGEGRDEMGGSDLNDLMSVSGLVGELDFIDQANLFLYGESRGGMMVLQAVRDGFPARAAATYGAFTDLEAILASPEGIGMARSLWPEFDSRRAEIVKRRSAVLWPEKLDLPLLLMHGSEDRSISPVHTLRLAVELAGAGGEFGVIVYPGGSHILHEYRDRRDQAAVDFFRRHMTERP